MAVCSGLIVVHVAYIHLFASQAGSQRHTVLPPPKPGLVEVHLPNLMPLENDVRNQLSLLEQSVAAALRSAAGDDQLSEAYGSLGKTYHAYSLHAPARECYLNAHALAPNDFRWVYLLAKLAHQEGRVKEAIERYQIARTLRPDYIAVHVNLGNLYLEQNRHEEALTNFAAALKVQEDTPAAHYGMGQVALSQRKFADAINHFQKALAQAPEANRIHYALAMAYRGLKDHEKARQHLAQQGPVGLRVADPLVDRFQELVRGERVHMVRGRLALEAKRYEEGAAEFRKAVTANPESVPALVNLGAALTQTGDLKGAAEQFQRALRIDPSNTNAHYNLAVLLMNDQQYEAAIKHLEAVAKINPNDLNARFQLGQAFSRLNRLDEALDQFTLIVQADPGNEEALLEQVRLLLHKKFYRRALEALEKGHARYPQNGRTAAMLAQVLAASPEPGLRDGARALKLAQMVYEATSFPEHGALLAAALAELGHCREAADWQRRMIAMVEQQRVDATQLKRMEDLARQLRADLQRYEKGPPCRPDGRVP